MSKDNEIPLFDYKGRVIGDAFIRADGGLTLDLVNNVSIILLSNETTKKLLWALKDWQGEPQEDPLCGECSGSGESHFQDARPCLKCNGSVTNK